MFVPDCDRTLVYMLDGALHIGHIVMGHMVELDDRGSAHVEERLPHTGDRNTRFDRRTTDAQEVFALHVHHRTLCVIRVFHVVEGSLINTDDLLPAVEAA
jgi:hypothetical protein